MKFLALFFLVFISISLGAQIECKIEVETDLFCRIFDTKLIGPDSLFYPNEKLKEINFLDESGYIDSVIRYHPNGNISYSGKNFLRKTYYSDIYKDSVSFASSSEVSYNMDGSFRSSGSTIFTDDKNIIESYIFKDKKEGKLYKRLNLRGQKVYGAFENYIDADNIVLNIFEESTVKLKIFIENPYDDSGLITINKIEITGGRKLESKRELKKYLRRIKLVRSCDNFLFYW